MITFASVFLAVLVAGVAFAGIRPVGVDTQTETDPGRYQTPPSSVPVSYPPAPPDDGHSDEEPVATLAGAAGTGDTTPPTTRVPDDRSLIVLHPIDGQHFDEQKIAFEGMAPIGWTVTAAGYQAEVDDAGHWRIVLILSPGGNRATIVATSADGSETATVSLTAFYDVADTASQGTGSTNENAKLDRREANDAPADRSPTAGDRRESDGADQQSGPERERRVGGARTAGARTTP